MNARPSDHSISMAEHALAYAQRGFPVFPCDPANKQPLVGRDKDAEGKPIPKTGGLHKASRDESQIREWWSRYPRAMIGLRMGPEAGVFALDPDRPKEPGEPDGLAAWDELSRAHGYTPATHAHVSPRGGMHLLFAYPADLTITNSPGQLPAGIDVRGSGGYVIAPPSRTADGREYRLAQPEHGFRFEPAPDFLLDLLRKPEPAPPSQPGPKRTTSERAAPPNGSRSRIFNDDVPDSYILRAVEEECAAVALAPRGQRNEALNRAAFKLGTIVGAGRLDAGTATRRLLDAATASGLVQDDGQAAALATIESGLTSGAAHPREFPERKARSEAPAQGQQRPRPGNGGEGGNDNADLGRAQELDGGVVTQDGVARVFAERFTGKLRYCHHTGGWFRWSGTHWQRDETDVAFQYARRLGRETTDGAKDSVLKEVRKVTFASGVERFARGDEALAVTAEAWDRDPWLLGTPGGTVDLRTGDLRPADPREGITKLAAVEPTELIDCPTWLRFLDDVTQGDEGYIRFIQQWGGYCLTGDTREQALCFAYGGGGNGKGVLIRVLSGILADYAMMAAMETFTASKYDRHPTEIASLRGKRLVTASETEQGRQWAESRIKQLTGGDRMRARYMRQDEFEFDPVLKLLLIGNDKPSLSTVDDAARRRFNLLPFNFKPAVADQHLETRLQAEWPSILRWLIVGCLDWQANGLNRPAVVSGATEEYFAEQDVFGQWLDEACIVDKANPYRKATTGELFGSWSDYARASSEPIGTERAFSQALQKRHFPIVKNVPTPAGGRARGFSGIELRRDATREASHGRSEF